MNRNSQFFKPFSIVCLTVFLFQILYPTFSYALTGGPSQPETQGFTPAGVTDLVDPFSGDFSYNIPLMDVGGYPIGLSYNSGITMEQEATWVGLGWNINPGVINRNVRGIPDDFKGDEVVNEFNVKPNRTYGASASVASTLELAGLDFLKKAIPKLSVGKTVKFNNYSGVSLDTDVSATISSSKDSKSKFTAGLGFSLGNSGATISPSFSFSGNMSKKNTNNQINTKIGSSFNSRSGLQAISFTTGLTASKTFKREGKSSRSVSIGNKTMSSGFISFATPSYTPTISNSFKSRSFSVSFSVAGAEFFGLNPQAVRVSGFYSDQVLKEHETEAPSFGYLYYQDGINRSDAVLDFNREKDKAYSKEIKNLAITSPTYDIFSVSGEGIGGSYRLFRNDVGTVYDNTSKNTTGGLSIGGPEFGIGALATKGGVNLAVNSGYTETSRWEEGNYSSDVLNFNSKTNSDESEPVYFRKSGEKNVMSDSVFFTRFGGFDAIRFDLESETSLLAAKKSYTDLNGKRQNLPNKNLSEKRQARNEAIIHYSAERAAHLGLFKKVRKYKYNEFELEAGSKIYKIDEAMSRYETGDLTNTTAKKAHHLSEINVFSGDGRRYVYSDPIYNLIKKEITFATNKTGSGLVSYTGQDNSKNNKNGLDNYFNRVVTPAYPTAFLLSAIVSTDYLDIDDVEGPSDDDLGTYTKFNYHQIAPYKWRTPVSDKLNKATLNEGFKTKSHPANSDNKANYSYGEKEVKYLHSIETKTHVAEFELENRNDGVGVISEYGGIDQSTSQLKRLKEIRLYAKADKLKDSDNAIPIKTVHFEYDYSLCKGVANNPLTNSGKLTLKEVYFTYGNSKRGKLSPYKFKYDQGNNATLNADYTRNSNDRWGTYQPNTGTPDNTEFPYTSQNYQNGRYDADAYASAWSMSEIELPSGGIIKVEYEADDYAYVQNRKAMQMFKIAGFSETRTGNPGPFLYGDGGSKPSHLYLKIAIPPGYSMPLNAAGEFDINSLFYDRGKRIEDLYFKVFINVENESLPIHLTEKREYVYGYSELNSEPEMVNNYLTIELKEKDNCNPISLATFNFMKRNFPEVVYQQDRPGSGGVERIFNILLGRMNALKDLVTGINSSLKSRNIGKEITEEKSWIRLYNPNGFKKGGGHRVKKVVMNDNWSSMAKNNHQDSEYGQEYDYTMKDDYGKTISSGVAAYEPIIGNEENPFRQPRYFDKKNLLVPDEEFYSEEPMGESFFPGASVGYRKVTIKNLGREEINNTPAGKTVKEFYTAYDYPTIAREKPILVARRKPISILKLLKLDSKDYISTSQGYVVELNDMHGKQKAEWVYQEDDLEPYSGMEYKYKELSQGRIGSKDLVIDKSGKITKNYIGVEMDLIGDTRQSYSSTTSGSGDINNDFFTVPAIIPIPINLFAIWPTYSNEKVRYSSIVMNKVVKRHGLLKETIYYSQKSKVGITRNLIRDAESGEVLLTETENEYGDPLYTFKYPAYWAYDDMGPVYKTMDISIRRGDYQEMNQFLKVGDQVQIKDESTISTAWVAVLNGSGTRFIDKNGLPVTTSSMNAIITVVNPINTNQQAQTVGQIVSKRNPAIDLNNDNIPDKLVFEEVLQASAMEYTEQAAVFCNCGPSVKGVPINPYTKGTKGLWKPWREFSYLTDRTQTRENKDVNIRKDGAMVEFKPFWTVNPIAGRNWQPNYNQWIYTAEASIFNPYGKELESKDALGRYSSALFGYNHALPTAVAKNAKYQNIAFDGFEDYGTESCEDDHFSFENIADSDWITKDEHHSGKKSIKVSPNSQNSENGGEYVLRKVLVECE